MVLNEAMRELLLQAIDEAGGLTEVSRRLGESPSTVSNWVSRGVPVARCAAFDEAVFQKTKRWQHRPDDWFLIWPELQGAVGAPPVPEAAEA
jgi:DNA-binding transcriptional regulator YdaS (Cro superfamily)